MSDPSEVWARVQRGLTVFLLDLSFCKSIFLLRWDDFVSNFKKEAAEDSPEKAPQSLKFKLNAIYYSINTDTNELFLLLEDLQTIEVIKLNIVQ